MKVKELIEELQKCDPEEEIYIFDGEYGPEETTRVSDEKMYNRDPTTVKCII